MDGAHGAMEQAVFVARVRHDGVGVDLDFNAQIDAAFAYGIAQVLKGVAWVTPCIAGDDVSAASSHQLVDAKVLEMPAVADIDT